MLLAIPFSVVRTRRGALLAIGLAVVGGTAVALLPSPSAPKPASAAAPQISVAGNHLVDPAGRPIQLRGVNRPSFEFVCVEPKYTPSRANGVNEGPFDQAHVNGMLAWGVNAVRIPLNEDCWLGKNPVKRTQTKVIQLQGKAAKTAGKRMKKRYRAAVVEFVALLEANGITPIVDLHWSAPGRTLAAHQYRAPDADHSIPFWRSVATTFLGDHSIIFDLFNEPLDVSWECLRDGCRVPNSCADCETRNKPKGKYRSAGMQELVDVIRATGATQPLMIPGLDYSHDVSRWLEFRPTDPLNQLIVSVHNYHHPQFAESDAYGPAYWDSVLAPIAAQHPLVIGEFGEFGCGTERVTELMNWADDHGVSYLAWGWLPARPYGDPDCTDLVPELVLDYEGTPAPTGVAIRTHMRQRAGLE